MSVLLFLRKAGLNVAAHGTQIEVSPADKLTDDLRRFIRQNKGALIEELTGSLSSPEIHCTPAQRDATDEPVLIEPACRPDGSPLSPIFWERGDGSIVGPAVPEFLAQVGGEFWIVVTFAGETVWINSGRLRSRKQFETQRPLRVVERIKECR